MLGSGLCDQVASHHQGLLVRQGNATTARNGHKRQFKPGGTHDSGQYNVQAGPRGGLRQSVSTDKDFYTQTGKTVPYRPGRCFCSNYDTRRTELTRLLYQQSGVRPGGKHLHVQRTGMTPDYVQGLGTNGPG